MPNTNFYRAAEMGAPADDLEAFGIWAANRIEEMILFEGPETVAAVFLEPVQNSGGCFPPPPGYFQRVREICDQYDVLLVSDEVICAFGRIGHMFACDAYGYVPDMITCAKGDDVGLLPHRRDDRLARRSTSRSRTGNTSFYHGYTFGGHPVSAAVALENLDIFEEEGLNERVRENSPLFRAELEKLLDLPIVGDVRGDGYFFGIELVKDKATKETFDDDESERLLRGFLSKALFDAGLYCRADDRGDPVIQLAPPLTIGVPEFQEIEQILQVGAHRSLEPPLMAGGPPGDRRRTRHLPHLELLARRSRRVGTRRPFGAPGARRGRPVRRLHRRRRADRAVDGVLRSRRPTPACASPCSSARSPGSARRAATAAGARRCSHDPRRSLEREHGFDAAVAMRRRWSTPSTRSVGWRGVEGIDCDFERGGTVVFARDEVQRGAARADVDRGAALRRRPARVLGPAHGGIPLRCDRARRGRARRDVRPGVRAAAPGEARAGTRSGGRGARRLASSSAPR